MINKSIHCAIGMMAVSVGLAVSLAQTTAAAAEAQPAPQLSATEQWIQDVKKPAEWFSWGADLRLRNEYVNNAVTLGNDMSLSEQDYFRFRGRVWTSLAPIPDLSLNARLSAEPREWMKESFAGNFRGQQGLEWRYGILDILNITWKNIAGAPLTLVVGRQDIQLGDTLNWWLVADGTPGDGSWTFFLDAARLTLDLKDAKTRIDGMYIYQSAEPDAWLPTIGRSSEFHHENGARAPYGLTEQTEQGAILYVSNKSLDNTQLDVYYMYKNDTAEYRYGDNANLNTVGAKIGYDFTEKLRLSGEGAYQFGNKQVTLGDFALTPGEDRNVSAWGFNSRLTYNFKDQLKNQLRLNFEYLSGDNPGTGKNEGFDLLWGRWPRWSELYIYSYIPEYGRVAQVGNHIRFGPAYSVSPAKGLDFSIEYNAVFADREFSNPDGVALPPSNGFGDGQFRGHYVQGVLRYRLNQHMAAHLWAEFFWMGDYYQSRDMMSFLRAEMMFTF